MQGGQPWQDVAVFTAMLAHLGGRDLYLKLYRDRDPKAIRSEEFKKVLQAYKRLQN